MGIDTSWLDKLKLDDLKIECGKLGLSKKGKKIELKERLSKALTQVWKLFHYVGLC